VEQAKSSDHGQFDLKAQTKGNSVMRTLTGYGIGVVIVFAILNGIAWLLGNPLLHGLNVFSAGFVLGMLGTSIAVYLYGYRKPPLGREQL
jgi:hypothetical protein